MSHIYIIEVFSVSAQEFSSSVDVIDAVVHLKLCDDVASE